MKQITIEIPDKKFQFVIDLLSNFSFIRLKMKETSDLKDKDIEYVRGLKGALNEVDEHLKGRKKLQRAKDFLNEILNCCY